MPTAGHDEEWLQFAHNLRIQAQLLPAIQEALRQGNWRTARTPRAYLKTVAKREAIRIGLVAKPDKERQIKSSHDQWSAALARRTC